MTRTTGTPWVMRERADASEKQLVAALREALVDLSPEAIAVLDGLLPQALADAYEAGYETGYAQHPYNKQGA